MLTRIQPPTLDVLAALLAADNHEAHGYQLIKDTHRHPPTVYKVLERLADNDLVTERWETLAEQNLGRPRRRYYRLNDAGVREATELLAQYRLHRAELPGRNQQR